MGRKLFALWLLLAALMPGALLLAAASGSAPEAIALETEAPLLERATALHLERDGRPAAGATVEVTYRANSKTSFHERLGPAGAAGALPWTPRAAGIVQLAAFAPGAAEPFATRTVAVGHGHMPASGALVMTLAGLALFGGAVAGFRVLLRG